MVTGEMMSTIMPATCDSGRYEMTRSCGSLASVPIPGIRSIATRDSNRMLSCEIMTALGDPVVPDV